MTSARLIGTIYEAALDPAHLGEFLSGVSAHAEASLGHVDIEDSVSGQVIFVAAHRMDDGMREQYLNRYRALDPRRALLRDAAPGEWRLTQDHFDDKFLQGDPFYREFAIPRGGGHGAVTYLDYGLFRGFVCLGRPLREGPFPDSARRRLASLSPHIRRASDLTSRAGRSLAMQYALRALLDHLADSILVVARDGRLLHGNATGIALLEAADGLLLEGGQVRAQDLRAHRLLSRTLDAVALANPRPTPAAPRDATLHIPRGQGSRPWLVAVLPIAPPTELGAVGGIPCAALWIRDADREKRITPAWLQFALGITPAEARVAHAVFLGASIGEAAGQLGVGEATAKSHLASVFAKTGVHRQADLVRFISHLKPNFR